MQQVLRELDRGRQVGRRLITGASDVISVDVDTGPKGHDVLFLLLLLLLLRSRSGQSFLLPILTLPP
jgi:hypothetical protein